MPTMWETWVLSLGQQDPLEKEMATHFSTLAWKLSWIQEPSKLQSVQSQRVGYDWVTSPYLTFPTLLYCQTLISIHDYWEKKIALILWTFIGRLMSLLLILCRDLS